MDIVLRLRVYKIEALFLKHEIRPTVYNTQSA
jgi:hypothetical protein